MSTKIYAGVAESGPKSTTANVSAGPSTSAWRLKAISLQRSHAVSGLRQRFYKIGCGWLERAYKRLPPTIRATIRVGISLYVTLYNFFTVPFRIAFYYDPLAGNELVHQQQWTTELSTFIVMDFIVDMIALFEFIRRYRSKGGSTRRFSSFAMRRTAFRKSSLVQPSQPSRSKTKRLQHEESKWTLTSLERSTPVNGMTASKATTLNNLDRKRNLKFYLDLVSLLPVEIFPYASGSYNTLHLVRVTKLCHVYRLKPCLERIIDIYSDRVWVQFVSSVGVKSLVRNIALCLGLCHYVACGYMLIVHIQCGILFEACDQSIETSWAIRDRLPGATVARKYARTIYWASRTVMLLGFDELAPVSDVDTIYVIFVTVIGVFFVSSLLASFLFLFRFWNARDAAFATHVDNAREYMRSQNIPRVIRRQVIEYFNYSWTTHQSLDSEEALQLMPKHFQLKVVSTLKASRIRQVCFLMKESVEFTNLLAGELRRHVYSPTDTIIATKLNTNMFFVIRGTVELSCFSSADTKECKTGDFFAEACLLVPEKFEEKAIAKTFCELYVLSKMKFDEAMINFYRDAELDARERMAEILEKYLTQQRKTKKLLGIRGRLGSGGPTIFENQSRSSTAGGVASRRDINWKLPGSVFRAYWDGVRLLSILYVAFEVPYYMVFISTVQHQHVLVGQDVFGLRYCLTVLVELLFGVNIILHSRFLAHLDPVAMIAVEDPELIFKAYKSDGFYLDLLAWIPVGSILETMATATRQNYPTIFRFLRLLRLREVPSLLANVSDFYSASSKTRLVISLVLGISFLLHLVGCVWFEMAWIRIGEVSDNDDRVVRSSLTRPDCLEHATLFSNCSWVIFDCYAHIGLAFPAENPQSTYQASFAYLRSMYWAIVTLTTVGYGDITAYSTGESYFAAFWVFVGGIINFATVGAMSSTISNAMAPHRQHVEKLNNLSSTLETMGISELLSTEIRHFYHLNFTGRKQAYESQLLSNLPDRLCYEISSLLHSEAVNKIALFDSASIEFLREVTGKFRHRSYQNGDTIYLEGDICREFLILLRGSKVNVFFRSRKVPVRALHDGDCYGVNEFLLRYAHPATLIAASLVHASVMTRDQFENIQRKFDDDLKDIKEEAQVMLMEEHKCMRQIMQNLEKLKLQTHLMTTSTLFYQGELAITTPTSSNVWSSSVAHTARSRRVMATALWNAVITCWNIYNTIFIIFRVCFHSHLHFTHSVSVAVWVADLSCDVCYVADIYLRLYYIGILEIGVENLVERKEVDRQYLRSSAFKWDVMASLPLYTPFSSGALTASLCRIPRLIRCLDLWTYLDDLIVQVQQRFASRNVSSYLSPVKLVIILMLVAHHVGCVFFVLSERECKYVDRCWIYHDSMLSEYNHSLSMMYAKSFYWAITTLLLAGLREIVPRDTAATVWTGVTCLGCTFIIGHIVGEISDLFQELSRETKQYKNRLANFDRFANENDLPELLVKRVGYFFREQYQHANGDDIHDIVHDLSANLRLKLMIEVYGSSISLLPIGRYLTASQINNLALRLKSEVYIPGDNIVVEGKFGNRLCTLRRGLAAAFWTNSVTSVAVLMEGALFGEVAFFISGQQRLATVRATTSCEVLYVTKQDWVELWTTKGDLSDFQLQKHAQHAILEWIRSRLQRYQRFNLRVANDTTRLLAARRKVQITAAAAKGTARAKKNLSAVLLNHTKSTDSVSASASALPVMQIDPMLAPQLTSLNRGTEVNLLRKKAEYLLTTTDGCIQKYHSTISSLHAKQRSSSVLSRQSTRSSISRRSDSNGLHGLYRNMVGYSTSPVARNSASDIHALQFIVETNPTNKDLCASVSDEHLLNLEGECWSRFKLLATAEYEISMLLTENAPAETTILRTVVAASGSVDALAEVKIRATRNKLNRARSFRHAKHASEKQNLQHPVFARGDKPSTLSHAAKPGSISAATRNSSLDHYESLKNRRASTVALKLEASRLQNNPEHGARSRQTVWRKQRGRSNSLPLFGHIYFDELRRKGEKPEVINSTQSGLDFGILQRLRLPKHGKPAEFTHWFRTWTRRNKPIGSTRNNHFIDTLSEQVGAKPVESSNRPSTTRLPLVVRRYLLFITAICFRTKEWMKETKQVKHSWQVVMLLVAIYHLIVTPLKVCFSADLAYLSASALRGWSAFEIFLDVMCALDILTNLQHKYDLEPAGKDNDQPQSQRVVSSEWPLYADIIAMLPLELLIFAPRVRVPLSYVSSSIVALDVSWWATRSMLRANRILLIRRVEPLFGKVLRLVVDDDTLRSNESLLYFLQGLAAYLSMVHLLACTWYFTNNLGRLLYETNHATDIEQTARVLSESASTTRADAVALVTKYLRSLLFAVECISTLFYGDILAMNPVEVVIELGITLWSIYVYGALVGAQGELFDSRARREATFEQILSQLQRYLVQNEVPHGIKQQVKAYYTRLWHNQKGDTEFKAVEGVSRALYEDVALSSVCRFVVQVKAFEALDDHYLRALIVCLQHVVCSENDEVFVIGDMDRSMYFIAQGRISVNVGLSQTTREHGEYFGELGLLYGIARLETCVALTISEMYRLDHEPYERVLQDFPEYRARNKLAWTTVPSESLPNQLSAKTLQRVQPSHSDGKSYLTTQDDPTDNQVLQSYIYRCTMDLLAKLTNIDPQEAKDLVLKGRDGARRHLQAALGVATSHDKSEFDEVQTFNSRSPTPTSRGEDPEKSHDSMKQLENSMLGSLKRTGSSTSKLARHSIVLLRRQTDSATPQLHRSSSSTSTNQLYSGFVDPVLDPTAVKE